MLEIGQRLPVNGKGQDVFTKVDNDYDEIYQKLVEHVLSSQGINDNVGLGNTPFQYSIQECKPCKPGTIPNGLKRIYSVVKKNPDKCRERNMAGYNLYFLAYLNKDEYTSVLLLRLLLQLPHTDINRVSNDESSLLSFAAGRYYNQAPFIRTML